MISKDNIKKLLDIRNEWIDQINYCSKGVGKANEAENLRKETIKNLKHIIPSGYKMIERGIDRLTKERFTLWSGQNGYLLKNSEEILKTWLNFMGKVINEIKIYPIKIYLDSSIITFISKIDDKNAIALRKLSENPRIIFYTSEKAKREIENYKGLKGQAYLIFIYNLIKKIPEENIIKFIPATFGSIGFNSATFGGGSSTEDFLFTNLKQIFEKDDAEHIFQAEKHNLDYFLTLDQKTIIKRVRDDKEKLKKINLNIQFVSPDGLLQKLKLN